MAGKIYEKPELIDLALSGVDVGFGECAYGFSKGCGSGTTKTTTNCYNGKYANTNCSTGTSVGKTECKNGSKANYCSTGTSIS